MFTKYGPVVPVFITFEHTDLSSCLLPVRALHANRCVCVSVCVCARGVGEASVLCRRARVIHSIDAIVYDGESFLA